MFQVTSARIREGIATLYFTGHPESGYQFSFGGLPFRVITGGDICDGEAVCTSALDKDFDTNQWFAKTIGEHGNLVFY